MTCCAERSPDKRWTRHDRVCSAFVLLPDQQEALRFWTEKPLEKGGRIIVNVRTEDLTLQSLMTYHLPAAIGLSDELSRGRLRIKDCETLAMAFKEAGLVVEQKITTKSHLASTWYDSDLEIGLGVFENQIANNYLHIAGSGKAEEARKA